MQIHIIDGTERTAFIQVFGQKKKEEEEEKKNLGWLHHLQQERGQKHWSKKHKQQNTNAHN